MLYEVIDLDDPIVRRAKLEAVAGFEAAQSLYEAGEFEAAIICLEKLLAQHPSDYVVEVLLQRLSTVSALETI